MAINGELFNINFHDDLINVNELLANAIAKKTHRDKKMISAILFALGNDVEFNRLLRALNPI